MKANTTQLNKQNGQKTDRLNNKCEKYNLTKTITNCSKNSTTCVSRIWCDFFIYI